MRRGFVGWCVGLHVGFFELPDTWRPSGINSLSTICRVCRVFQERREVERIAVHCDTIKLEPARVWSGSLSCS